MRVNKKVVLWVDDSQGGIIKVRVIHLTCQEQHCRWFRGIEKFVQYGKLCMGVQYFQVSIRLGLQKKNYGSYKATVYEK